ncbi:MAG: HDIG domain-containing protein [Bacteroidales bacterium]
MTSSDSLPELSFREKLIRILLYVAATAIIVYFLPREGKFRYHFQEGRPWKYGLLTASFDFPIYKTDAQIQFERDSIMQRYHPYYKMDKSISEKQIGKLADDYRDKLRKSLSAQDYRYLTNSLQILYKEGLLTPNEQSELERNQTKSVRILDQNVSKLKQINTLKTVREAYESILSNAPSEESRRSLRNSNINLYLQENLTLDTLTSQKVKNELLQTISASSGLVQAGERIVDRGEIITPQTYNILRSLEMVNQKRAGTAGQQSLTLIGQILITLLLLGSLLVFQYLYRPAMFHKLRDVEVVLLLVTSMIMLSSFLGHFRLSSIYLVPFALVPIVIRTFLDSRVAFFAHIVTITISSFLAPFAFEFFLLQVSVGITTIFSLKELTQRSQLLKVAIFVFLTYSVVYVGYTLIMEGDWDKINPTMFVYFVINATLLLFAYLLIFILEKALGFTSNVTLVELSNINAPLLRRLSEECPGTFQHSLQISNLCAQAARRIGANVQLIRTGALYHDIGKLQNPSFFTENQHDINPHNQLTIEQSIGIIKQHVSDGLKLAQKEKLPEEITAFIATHHGAGTLKYFYNKWHNEHPDEQINENIFHYPGPNPSTKEQALLMMADSIEAASRSLKDYSDDSFTKLVNKLIDTQISEGMFNNTPLTFRDVQIIKEVFIERLKTMYHARISYPELLKPEGK